MEKNKNMAWSLCKIVKIYAKGSYKGNIRAIKNFVLLIIAIAIMAYIVLLCFVGSGNLGTTGDYFGGILNPILAFLSLMALLKTISIQSKELKLTREELTKSAEAQERSSQIFEQQRFENTFFSLLETINLCIKEFKQNNKYYLELKNLSNNTNNEFMCVMEFSRIAILIYQALKFINNYDKDGINTKKYSAILRSCLDTDILQLLAINCYNDEIEDMYKFRDLMNQYEILEHMKLVTSSKMNQYIGVDSKDFLLKVIHEYMKNGYKNIFGKNQYIKKINFNS